MLAASFVASCSKGGGRASSGKPDSKRRIGAKESKKSFEVTKTLWYGGHSWWFFVMGQADETLPQHQKKLL